MSEKLVMVDLDGTLVDTSRVNYFAYKKAMNLYGFELDFDYFCKYCYGRHYLDFLPIITTDDKEVLNKIHYTKKVNYKLYLHEAVLNNALVDILRLMKMEYKTALVTTASRQNTYDILNHYHLQNFFDLILTHEDVNNSKPDPEGYNKAMQYFHTDPANAMIFEDSESGIEAAKRAGCSYFRTYFNIGHEKEEK